MASKKFSKLTRSLAQILFIVDFSLGIEFNRSILRDYYTKFGRVAGAL